MNIQRLKTNYLVKDVNGYSTNAARLSRLQLGMSNGLRADTSSVGDGHSVYLVIMDAETKSTPRRIYIGSLESKSSFGSSSLDIPTL